MLLDKMYSMGLACFGGLLIGAAAYFYYTRVIDQIKIIEQSLIDIIMNSTNSKLTAACIRYRVLLSTQLRTRQYILNQIRSANTAEAITIYKTTWIDSFNKDMGDFNEYSQVICHLLKTTKLYVPHKPDIYPLIVSSNIEAFTKKMVDNIKSVVTDLELESNSIDILETKFKAYELDLKKSPLNTTSIFVESLNDSLTD